MQKKGNPPFFCANMQFNYCDVGAFLREYSASCPWPNFLPESLFQSKLTLSSLSFNSVCLHCPFLVFFLKAGHLQPFFVTIRKVSYFFFTWRPCEIMGFYTILVSQRHFQGAGYRKTAKNTRYMAELIGTFAQSRWNFLVGSERSSVYLQRLLAIFKFWEANMFCFTTV